MNNNSRAAIKGALLVGVPFGLWTLLLVTSVDSTSGSVLSFGVALPAIIIGFPWGLGWLLCMSKIQSMIGQSSMALDVISFIGLASCPAINGAIIGYRRSKKNET